MTGWFNEANLADVTANAYSVGPIAAIISPFFLGMIADRFFPSQWVLAALHLIGGALLMAVPQVGASAAGADGKSFLHPVTLLLLGHMLCYMPTLGLTNSLTLHNVTNAEKQFPMIRVWGTIGWIVGNFAVGFLPDGDKSPMQFQVAGGAAILLALYSLTLPHTPPPSAGKTFSAREALGLDALALLKKPAFAVFILCSFLICIPLAGYYAYARNFVEATQTLIKLPAALAQALPFLGSAEALQNGAPVITMSLGQMSEIFFMLIMPVCFARLGVKKMLLIGMLAWVLRYGFFAAAWDKSGAAHMVPLVFLGVLLHGICYDFFFVTGQVYVDRVAPSSMRGQAQGFLILITQGVGMFIGAQVFGQIVGNYTTGTGKEAVIDWSTVWLIPAIAAGVIAVLFFALFREDRGGESVSDADIAKAEGLAAAH